MADEKIKQLRDPREDHDHVARELHRVHDRLATLPLGGVLQNIREPLADLVKALILAITGEPYRAPNAPVEAAHSSPPGGNVQMIPGQPIHVGGQQPMGPDVKMIPAGQPLNPGDTTTPTGAAVEGAQVIPGGPPGQVSAVIIPAPNSTQKEGTQAGQVLPPGATTGNK